MCRFGWLVALLVFGGMWGMAQEPSTPFYRLQPGDLLTITVLGEPELSGEMMVGPDGYLRLPLIGSLKAVGLTLDELEEALWKALQQYLRSPKVTVALKQFSPLFNRVYVLGAVKFPGAFPLPMGASPTIFDALAPAGGFTTEADLERVRVFHNDGRVSTVNLKGLQSISPDGRPSTAPIAPGDVVWVPPAFVQVAIVGDVEKAGLYPVPTRATLLEAVALAGGAKEPDALVRIFRNGTELLNVPWGQLLTGQPQTLNLQEGDTIIVAVREAKGVVVMGAVERPGIFDLKGGRVTLLGALALAGFRTDTTMPMRVRLLRQDQEVVSLLVNPVQPPSPQAFSLELQSGDIVTVEPLLVQATLVGPVRKPGTYELPAGSRIIDLLAKGEEVLPAADLTSATLIRRGEAKPIDLLNLLWEGDLETNVELQDGDTLLLSATRKIWVVGAVQRPGTVDYQPRMTVVDAIGATGGPRSMDEADLSAIRIISGGAVRIVDLQSAFTGAAPVIEPLKPGDVVIVPERAKAYIYGAVFRPGAVRVQQGDTVLTVLSGAGGPIPDSRLDESVLVRFVKNQAVVMKLDLKKALQQGDLSQAPVVQAGDVLYIPPRRRTEWDFGRVVGVVGSIATAVYYFSRTR